MPSAIIVVDSENVKREAWFFGGANNTSIDRYTFLYSHVMYKGSRGNSRLCELVENFGDSSCQCFIWPVNSM